ncbi:unnamed protein product [Pieris brassicae]|uniref:Uncharacterized protein n=1 Tax=Pieris brassicae TaxID=7116 RepID=A0A9P0XHW9_PIEBR|nr:unnamed protein product [Pieris brassicae]
MLSCRLYRIPPERIISPVTLNHSSCPPVSHKQDERGVGAVHLPRFLGRAVKNATKPAGAGGELTSLSVGGKGGDGGRGGHTSLRCRAQTDVFVRRFIYPVPL